MGSSQKWNLLWAKVGATSHPAGRPTDGTRHQHPQSGSVPKHQPQHHPTVERKAGAQGKSYSIRNLLTIFNPKYYDTRT